MAAMHPAPVLEHVSIWAKGDKTADVVALFQLLGWNLWPGRRGQWDTGSACFVYSTSGGPYIQITEETSQTPGSEGSATHVALAGDVDWMREVISDCVTSRGYNVGFECVGDNKWMTVVPELFEGAIELVPQVVESPSI